MFSKNKEATKQVAQLVPNEQSAASQIVAGNDNQSRLFPLANERRE